MNLDNLIADARSLLHENEPMKYAADPGAYNTALAKLMNSGLKKEKDFKVTNVRQNYKGTGSKSHIRQVFVRLDGHERGGPDVWLDNGFVKVGGVIDVPRTVVNKRQYGEDPPEVVYKWIVDVLKQVMDWQNAKYQQAPKPESKMNAEVNKKLEALRAKLEADLGEAGLPTMPAPSKGGRREAEAIPAAKMTGGSTPKMPAPAKNAMGSQDIKTKGAQSSPPSKKVAGSVLPSKMESVSPFVPANFKRLAGLDGGHRLNNDE